MSVFIRRRRGPLLLTLNSSASPDRRAGNRGGLPRRPVAGKAGREPAQTRAAPLTPKRKVLAMNAAAENTGKTLPVPDLSREAIKAARAFMRLPVYHQEIIRGTMTLLLEIYAKRDREQQL